MDVSALGQTQVTMTKAHAYATINVFIWCRKIYKLTVAASQSRVYDPVRAVASPVLVNALKKQTVHQQSRSTLINVLMRPTAREQPYPIPAIVLMRHMMHIQRKRLDFRFCVSAHNRILKNKFALSRLRKDNSNFETSLQSGKCIIL